MVVRFERGTVGDALVITRMHRANRRRIRRRSSTRPERRGKPACEWERHPDHVRVVHRKRDREHSSLREACDDRGSEGRSHVTHGDDEPREASSRLAKRRRQYLGLSIRSSHGQPTKAIAERQGCLRQDDARRSCEAREWPPRHARSVAATMNHDDERKCALRIDFTEDNVQERNAFGFTAPDMDTWRTGLVMVHGRRFVIRGGGGGRGRLGYRDFYRLRYRLMEWRPCREWRFEHTRTRAARERANQRRDEENPSGACHTSRFVSRFGAWRIDFSRR